MKLIIEEGDFPALSGKSITELADPLYSFRVTVNKAPDGSGTWGVISHHGSGYRVEWPQLTVEIEGVGVIGGERRPIDAAEPKMPKRGKDGKFVKVVQASWEAPLTGPRLQTLAWAEDE